ncbi:MAG: hypothetical protein AAB407_01335 [Patescibacteria group bacterium]
MKESIKVALVIVIVSVGIVFAATYLVASETFMPPEFTSARIEGARLAGEIVALADSSLANLEAVYRYNANKDTQAALVVVSQEILKMKEMQTKAIGLSTELEKMARSLEQIKPNKAKILATEAVSSEIALVSHLISYNDYLSQLFHSLKNSIEAPHLGPGQNIEVLVAKINEETATINELDRRFNATLVEFDQVFSN